MAEEDRTPQRQPETRPSGTEGETFKREGPEPPTESTGRSVEEMNEIAEDAVLRNIRPPDPEP